VNRTFNGRLTSTQSMVSGVFLYDLFLIMT